MEYRSAALAALLTLAGSTLCAAEGADVQRDSWDTRLERAAALQTEGKARRDAADRLYAEEDKACYSKILVNRCRDEARKRHVSEHREGKRLESEGKAIELQVKKEQREAGERQAEREAPIQAAEREARAAERAADQARQDADRAAQAEEKARKAEEGARRRAEQDAKIREKQAAHAARQAEARQKAAENAGK